MTPAASAPASPRSSSPWLLALVLGLPWLALLDHLRIEWTINAQYSYGWIVPLLAAYLFSQRWSDRPRPIPPARPTRFAFWTLLLALLAGPLRLVVEANPDWRLASWCAALLVMGLTLLLLHALGGWGWVRHLGFPVLFMGLAVPWPSFLEQALIQSLMQGVAGVTVECANWLGLPARQLGHLIQLPNGTIGVSEACSGVRSFQSTLMAAVFLGEWNRFSAARRAFLIAAGISLALIFNVARTYLLTWTMFHHGEETLQRWHDPAGYGVLLLSFATLWILCAWQRRRTPPLSAPRLAWDPAAQALGVVPQGLAAGLAAWWCAVAVGNEAWYRWHERHLGPAQVWTASWPAEGNGFKTTPIPDSVRLALRYDQGRAGVFLNDDGTQSFVFFFQWQPGRSAAQSARIHTPDTCLPAAGLRPVGRPRPLLVRTPSLELAFQAHVYDGNDRQWHVYHILWEDRASGSPRLVEDHSRASRFRAVWAGRRNLGQRVIEIAVTGATDAATSDRWVERWVQRWLQRGIISP